MSLPSTPPGDTLRELLRSMKITQTALAHKTGRPVKTINEILRAKARLTEDTAIDLEEALGVDAKFWLNLESNYRLDLARKKRRKTR